MEQLVKRLPRILRTIRSLPLRIPIGENGIEIPETLVIRGEVFMYLQAFEESNRQMEAAGEKTYQNPRNTAAGSLRQLDPEPDRYTTAIFINL